VFTKEVDTAAAAGGRQDRRERRGDRIFIRYVDQQNTIPGHAGGSAKRSCTSTKPDRGAGVRVIETRAARPVQVLGAPAGRSPRRSCAYLPGPAGPTST